MEQEFSPRLQQILSLMLRENRVISVMYLAEQMGISKRTVQRELEHLEKPLKKRGITFCSKTGVGVWLEGSQSDKQSLAADLGKMDARDISDRSERRKRLILEILKDKTLKKLYYYSDLFGVSEATVSADLEAVEEWFRPFHLQITRKPGYGVAIEGKEQDFRRALRFFIDENIDTRMIKDIYEEKNNAIFELVGNKNEKNIYRVLNDDLLLRVIACLQRINHKRILNLTENSYVGLVLHVTIAVNRIMKNEILEDNKEIVDSLRGDGDFLLAGRIIRELETEFGVAIPEVETAYICLHIKGSKVQQIELDDESKETVNGQRELMEVVSEMIERYDKDNAYLLKQDEDFVVRGLAAHLRPTLVRLANGMKIENPLLEQIKVDYPDIFRRCMDVAKVLEQHYGYEVPEPEIGYLAIHFGAAMVRLESRKEVTRQVRMGVVCASGIGISRLMASKLMKYFMERIELRAYGVKDLTPYVLENTDFFVSTLPLKESADILYVSPLLSQKDMEDIAAKVRRYERIPKRGEADKKDVFTRQLEQVNYIAAQIRTIIENVCLCKVEKDISFDGLLTEVSRHHTPYADERRIIWDDLKKREALGTQIFPELSFALLHARTAGVTRPVFSVFVPENRKEFTNPELKQIRAAVVMLIPEDAFSGENAKLLGFLSEKLVEEEAFLNTMLTGGEQAVRSLVSRYLKQYFNQYLDRF